MVRCVCSKALLAPSARPLASCFAAYPLLPQLHALYRADTRPASAQPLYAHNHASSAIALCDLQTEVKIQSKEFQHILRILNTNVDGTRHLPFALTSITGLGRRFSIMVCKKAEVDLTKRAGEITNDEIERIVAIIQNPLQFQIPEFFLNRRKDFKTGKTMHLSAQNFAGALRNDLERMKKIRRHRGLRHYWGTRVRGQHTCTTGRGVGGH